MRLSFKDLLEVDRMIIAYYKPPNIRSLVISSNLKKCAGKINNTKYHCLAYRLLEPNNEIDIHSTLTKLEKKEK